MNKNAKQRFESIAQERDILAEGILRKSDVPYQIVLARPDDVPSLVALQDRVYDDLPESRKNFIVPKTKDFFEQHISDGHPIITVSAQGRVIAQSIIRAPSVGDDVGMTDMAELRQFPVEQLTILQGVLCDTAYRGNGLMEQMVCQWLQWAQDHDRPYALAEIEVRNHHSWSVFMKQGMWLVGLGRDEADGARLYNAFQNLEEEDGKVKYRVMTKLRRAFDAAASDGEREDQGQVDHHVIECGRSDLPLQNELMKQGYGCGTWDSARQVMTYKKRPF